MQPSILFAMGLVALAGAALALQAPLNAGLGRSLGSPFAAGMVTFMVSTLIMIVINIGNGAIGTLLRAGSVPWWAWLGGFLGPLYMMAVILSVPRIGVLTTFATLVAGQVFGAMLLDAVGAFGVPVQPLSLTRIAAVVFVSAGVYLSRL